MKHLITLISCIFTIKALRAESETQIEAHNRRRISSPMPTNQD